MSRKNFVGIAVAAGCWIVTGCTGLRSEDLPLPLAHAARLPEPDIQVEIPSLSNCTSSDDSRLSLKRREPVTVIVHGCYSSAGKFRSLADVFAFHGQQTACFSYDDRDSLSRSAAKLVAALDDLTSVLENAAVSVIGHSQGGLVARRALASGLQDSAPGLDASIRLTTISTPFGGIEAAAHCGSTKLAWMSLGMVKLGCYVVTGSKYREIPPNAEFINSPGQLLPELSQHLNISTDETDSCRRFDRSGKCIEDDFVFSLDEQSQPAIEGDARLSMVTVKAGHVEIVGDGVTAPTKLVRVLQEGGVLESTPAEMQKELARLLAALYLSH